MDAAWIKFLSVDTVQSLKDILLNFLIVLILSVLVYASYSMSYPSMKFGTKFYKNLTMISLITALIISVAGGSFSILLAALAIYLLLGDNNDIQKSAYILWSVAIGISCGVRQYLVAVIGSAVIFLFTVVLEIHHNR